MVLFIFQFYPFCHFEKFINFGLGTVRSESVKTSVKLFAEQKLETEMTELER